MKQSDKENAYQSKLIKKLRLIFDDCIILKNDTTYLQGVPDLLILHNNKWAMLEVKAERDSERQPNQEYYVDKLSSLSFAAFIFPENEEEVLYDLQSALKPRGATRILKRQ